MSWTLVLGFGLCRSLLLLVKSILAVFQSLNSNLPICVQCRDLGILNSHPEAPFLRICCENRWHLPNREVFTPVLLNITHPITSLLEKCNGYAKNWRFLVVIDKIWSISANNCLKLELQFPIPGLNSEDNRWEARDRHLATVLTFDAKISLDESVSINTWLMLFTKILN